MSLFIREEDNDSFVRGDALTGSSSGGATPIRIQEPLKSRLAIMATSHAFSEEIKQFAQFKTWDHYVSAYLGPWIDGAQFDAGNLTTT